MNKKLFETNQTIAIKKVCIYLVIAPLNILNCHYNEIFFSRTSLSNSICRPAKICKLLQRDFDIREFHKSFRLPLIDREDNVFLRTSKTLTSEL